MNRRDFLRQGLAHAGLGAWAMTGPGLGAAFAAPADRVLVVVFMRGGWDGLNVAVPYGDDAYYSLRPTIAISPPSEGNAQSALDLDGFFGFHPSLSALHELYNRGHVAVLPAVHYDAASQSHFVGQDIIESGISPSGTTGWLARYLLQAGGALASKAMSLTDQVPFSLTGLQVPVSTYPNIGNLDMATSASDREMLAMVVGQGYSWLPQPGNPHATAMHGIGSKLLNESAALQSVGQMAPASGAVYPGTTFARQMGQAAALIKARSELEVITLNCGGWDTHSAQGGGAVDGRMSQLLSGFSESVGAFFTDLGSAASRVTLLAVTEFGRTAAENGSQGTDHGNASTWLAIGPNVRGGVHLGNGWPGLQPSQLYKERYLAHSVDFRSIYANVLTRFMGTTNIATILPDFSGNPVDIVA
jgi:uncharacterized protein (DUF1501 family)